MLCTFEDNRLNLLIGQLLKSIHCNQKKYKKDNSGIYLTSDSCLKTLLADSRNYIIEIYNSYSELKIESLTTGKHQFLNHMLLKNNTKLIDYSKRSHFGIFKFKETLFSKSVIEQHANFSGYKSENELIKEMLQSDSILGLKSIEFIRYFNFLTWYYEGKINENCYIINIYKKSRISVFSFKDFNDIFQSNLEHKSENNLTPISAF